MKIVVKPIKALMAFEPKGKPPIHCKFKMETPEKELATATVDHLISISKGCISEVYNKPFDYEKSHI